MGKELTDFLKSRKKMNLCMVIANILIFVIMEIQGDTTSVRFMVDHGAMYPPAVLENGEYYRLFTAMFLHFGFEHLAYNMLLLLFAGDMLERQVGAVRYLILYLGGGMAGSLLSYGISLFRREAVVSAGASGAIFAVVGALLCIVWKCKGNVPGVNGRGLAAMAVLNVMQAFMNQGVDNAAHLGGALGGFLLALILFHPQKTEKPFQWENEQDRPEQDEFR